MPTLSASEPFPDPTGDSISSGGDLPFRIKICGVRTVDDVRNVSQAGADAIGLNFYSPSVRSLQPDSESTESINEMARKVGLTRVGLFVNHELAEVSRVASRLHLDWVQLHGDETVDAAASLIQSGHRVLRAIRLPRGELSPSQIDQRIGKWAELPVTLLLDADAGAAFGGGGMPLDWACIRKWAKRRSQDAAAWVLAGGLTSENVAEAIVCSGAQSVDVASGVEQPKGTKNAAKIRQFVAAVRLGFQGPSDAAGIETTGR